MDEAGEIVVTVSYDSLANLGFLPAESLFYHLRCFKPVETDKNLVQTGICSKISNFCFW